MGETPAPDDRRRGAAPFFLIYLAREMQRRKRQALLVAVGLAVGIGLAVTVTAASAGVTNAEGAALHSLYGIGNDVTVTKAAPAPNPGSPARTGSSGSAKFGFSPGKTPQHEDLLGYPPGLGVLDASSVASISRLHDVAAAAGVLTLTDTKLTVPSLSQLGPQGQPPPGAVTPTTFSVDGVDLAHLGLGPLASAKISSGRSSAMSDATSDVAVVDSGYATANKLIVGSTITIAHIPFKVVGVVRQPQGASAADVYIPLGRAQALAASPEVSNSAGKVDTIYVAAASAADIPAVQKEIARLIPSATVTSSGNLASDVSGSLASAASLATDLGRWLAIAVLIAAFAIASLLTMAAVARRVREFGTLKALGWRSRRIIAQIMGESAVIGVIGAVMGIALGFGGAALVDAIAPKLTATVAQNPGSAPAQDIGVGASGFHHSIAPGAEHTVAVHMSAPVTVTAIALAVVLAIAGALIAGSFGGWRASRLRPAEALAQVE
ncbi:MAG TPA: ABC transporter permease [Streptosporangiaceae bacterium]|nr:ABC transporter permease [Streptosporangiaceae bacterium]